MITTYFCKKGGVGKTTLLGEHADYLASQGKKVLVVSIDDQNSVFEMFGKFGEVFAREDNYLEFVLAGKIKEEDALIPLRDNIDGIKTLNTDMLSKKLTLERPFEKQFVKLIHSYEKKYDVVFFDLPPSSNRTSEVILEECDFITLIVELNKLGVNGLFNTIQYFVDADIDLAKVKYILPNGFAKNKSVPAVALGELEAIVKENLPEAHVLEPMPEKGTIEALQHNGVVVFDKRGKSSLTSYQRAQKKVIQGLLSELFAKIDF